MRRATPTQHGGASGRRRPSACATLLGFCLIVSLFALGRQQANSGDGSGFTSRQLDALSDRGLDALADDAATLTEICKRRGTAMSSTTCPPCATQQPCPTANAVDASSKGGSGVKEKAYLAMCLVCKDAYDDIREWVGHHKFIGASKVYLYDTGTKPPINGTLKDYISSGFVDYTWLVPDFGTPEKKKRPQMDLWKQCLADHGSKHQFIAFLDVDEFVMMGPRYRTLPQLLRQMQDFEPIGGLVTNWRMFGSSGHKTKPKGGVLQAYTKCEELVNQHGIHVKTIANTDFVTGPLSPHAFAYVEGKYAVDQHFQRIDGPTNHNVSADKVIVNHYFTKSLEEWNAKATRGTAMGLHKPFKYFQDVDENSVLECLEATKFGPYY